MWWIEALIFLVVFLVGFFLGGIMLFVSAKNRYINYVSYRSRINELKKEKRYQEAVYFIKQALKIVKTEDMYIELFEIYKKVGQIKDAALCLEEYLNLFDEKVVGYRDMEEIRRMQKCMLMYLLLKIFTDKLGVYLYKNQDDKSMHKKYIELLEECAKYDFENAEKVILDNIDYFKSIDVLIYSKIKEMLNLIKQDGGYDSLKGLREIEKY